MPLVASARIEGLDHLKQNFDELGRRARNQVIRKGLRAAGRPVVDEARRRAPRRTGKGARAIRSEVVIKGESAEVRVGVSKRRYYLKFHETGTRHHRAQPWLKPALLAAKDEAIQAFADATRDELTRIGG